MIVDQIQAFLGYDREVGEISAVQMAFRTLIIYAATLALIRIGSKRSEPRPFPERSRNPSPDLSHRY
jgi:hypothetical protein